MFKFEEFIKFINMLPSLQTCTVVFRSIIIGSQECMFKTLLVRLFRLA